MFKIQSTRAIDWPGFSLRKGENEFTSRKSVPPLLWPKLDRFRALKLLDFEGKAEVGNEAPAKLEDLTERQLYDLPKGELIELAKRSGVSVAGDAGKKAMLDLLVPKCKPMPKTEQEPVITVDPTGGGKAVVTNKPTEPAKPDVSVHARSSVSK